MPNMFLQIILPAFRDSGFLGNGRLCRFLLMLLLVLMPAFVMGDTSSSAGSISKKERSTVSAAFALYKEKAEQGDVEAQFNVGVMCETGWSVPVDNKKAVRWYREAAQQGHADAQIRLGMLYYLGVGAHQSDIKGQKWMREAAKQNHLLASNIYKNIFSEDVPDALLPASAIKHVRDAYLKDEKKALAVLDRIVNEAKQQDIQEEKKKEDSTMRERRVQRLNQGPVKPGFSASVEVERIKSMVPGFIGDASLEENRTLARGSVATIRRQAEKGLASAEYNLGRMYELGIKLPVDRQQAFAWYTKSAQQGYASAEYRLGVALLYGMGVQQDDAQGKRWLSLAAKHGHAVAKKMVEGLRSELGSVNLSMAANWYFEKALEGNAEAAFHLGKLYQYGWGVEVDSREAVKWYQRASDLGFQQADVALTKLELKMLEQNAATVKSKVEPETPTIRNRLEAMLEGLALPAWLAHPGLIAAVVVALLWMMFFRRKLRKEGEKN